MIEKGSSEFTLKPKLTTLLINTNAKIPERPFPSPTEPRSAAPRMLGATCNNSHALHVVVEKLVCVLPCEADKTGIFLFEGQLSLTEEEC